jgi:hypothetical protein
MNLLHMIAMPLDHGFGTVVMLHDRLGAVAVSIFFMNDRRVLRNCNVGRSDDKGLRQLS